MTSPSHVGVASKFLQMKTKLPSLALGFALGAVTLLLLGQSRSDPAPPLSRYTMLYTGSAVFVQDSVTGAVKIIRSTDIYGVDSDPTNSQQTMRLGKPF